MEVFSNAEEAFTGFENDPAALQAIFKTLHDPKPYTRRLAAEMLAKMGSPLAIPELVECLMDEDASVRAAATQALSDLDAKSAYREVILGLDDPDDLVREKTLASFPKLEVASSPELIRSLERMLDDANVKIQARAAMVLIYLGEPAQANAVLAQLLKDGNPDRRYATIDALRPRRSNRQRI